MALDDCERAAEILAHRRDEGVDPWWDYAEWSELALDRGRPRKARDIVDAARGAARFPENPDLAHVLHAVISDGDEVAAEHAYRRVVAFAEAAPPSDTVALGLQAQAIYNAELWRMAHDDYRSVDRSLAKLRQSPTLGASVSPMSLRTILRATPNTRILAIEALLSASQRRPDAMEKARALEALLDRHARFPSAALILVKVYEGNGDPKQALKILRRHMSRVVPLTCSTALREEGRLAELTGDREGAIRAYRRYLALRSDPEPERRAEVERVREALGRLVTPVP